MRRRRKFGDGSGFLQATAFGKNPEPSPHLLQRIYRRLYAHFGPQHWWPAETPFEVMVGAILTQNTAWTNVERGIGQLKARQLLGPQRLLALPTGRLQRLLRPTGYFRVKTRRLRAFLQAFQARFRSRIRATAAASTAALRAWLLAIPGIGEETADSILLYALNRPVFVVDAYTRRMLLRHRLISPKATYQELQHWFTARLPRRRALFNEFHALLVALGKTTCRATPDCDRCPLKPLLGKGDDQWR